MSKLEEYKEQMRHLTEAQTEFSKLNNQPHSEKNRIQLRKLLSKFTKHPYNMHMVMDQENNTVKLWASEFYFNHNMSSDLEIYVSGPKTTGVLMVCDDCLWGTISGLNEAVEEAKAEEAFYEREKMGRY